MGELYKLDFSNGKSYIGITRKTGLERFKRHKKNLGESGNGPLHRAWRKHGEPRLTTLAIVENEDLSELEIRAIATFKTIVPFGYNLSFGGWTSPILNPIIKRKIKSSLSRPEVKLKMSSSAKKNWKTEDHKLKLSKSQKAGWSAPGVKNKIISDRALPENKQIRSAAQSKAWKNPETRAKMSKAIKDSLSTPEAKRNKSIGAKSAWLRPEVIAKSKATMAKPEVKARYAAAAAKRWADPEYKARVSAKLKLAAERRKTGVKK